ncbi:hypothetical protein BZM27_16175 [Paraburkholderia steynii]|uniref:VOC domain-containing protein n=1 Tax=Paraburkholderia steynii TaxID=1245441 RepID=A0A4R0XGC7_9BURK|nr:hypothetical protein BZM27_16175 [Paraburkholderia steynii]
MRGLNHHAYYSTKPEETRHFYEDILEMPMTMCLRIPNEVISGKAEPYCHYFFEMGDGGCIAFFDNPTVFDGEPPFEVPSAYYHHIAINVDSDESIEYFRKKLEKEGYSTNYIDHGAFHSLYMHDPNGMNLELTYSPPEWDDFFVRGELVAREQLDSWAETRS